MQFRWPLPVAILALMFAVSTGAFAGSLEKQINNEYRGKILTLRQFCAGERLHFGPDGRLIGNLRSTSWTTDAQLEVEDLKLRGDVVELKGRRLRLVFDPSSKQLRDVMSISSSDEVEKRFLNPRNKKAWEQFVKSAKLEVTLDLGSTPRQESDVVAAIDRVFLSSNDVVMNVVPAFWKAFLVGKDTHSAHPVPTSDVYKVGGKVTPPHALSSPDPQYSEPARQAGYSGTLVLSIVVSPDGHVRDLSIVTPLGLGLDENAVDAVRGWTFDPARKEGNPVAVQVSVQVDFHLY